MSRLRGILGGLVQAVVTVLASPAFYATAFVVSAGAGLAGHHPSGDFVVLAAALLVVAALLGGIPFGGRRIEAEPEPGDAHTGFE